MPACRTPRVFPLRPKRPRHSYSLRWCMKIAVSILGLDCPGVVHLVSATLAALHCNIEEISQTILKGQFAAIFIADQPDGLAEDSVHDALLKAIAERNMSLSVIVRPLKEEALFHGEPSEPFVITIDGEDRPNIVASFTRIFAEHKANIENMKALMPDPDNADQSGKASARRAIQVFELALPVRLDRSAFRRTLEDKARSMGLRISMQHRDIFEALHRIEPM